MSYDMYLVAMSQLTDKNKARLVVQGSVIFIETTNNRKKWNMSTKVFSCDGYLPNNIRECVSSSGVLKWQERGAYLKLDPESNSVFLIHEVESSNKYVPFKYLMSDFVEVANEWKEVLDEFAAREHVSYRLDKES